MFRKIPLRSNVCNIVLLLATLCPISVNAQGTQEARRANSFDKLEAKLTVQYEQISICQGDSATLVASTNLPFPDTRWYDAPRGGKLLHIGSHYTVSPAVTTVYYAVSELFAEEGKRDSVTVTISSCQRQQAIGDDIGYVTVPPKAVKLQLSASAAAGELLLKGKENWNGSLLSVQDIKGREMQRTVLTEDRFRLNGPYTDGLYIVSVITPEGKVLMGKVRLYQ